MDTSPILAENPGFDLSHRFTRISFTQKGMQSASGKGRKLPGICPGATTIVAPKSVGSRTTNRQMKAIFLGEFDGFPGRRVRPNHADRLDRASRVLSARTPSKKPQAKKSPPVLSVEKQHMSLLQAKRPKRPNQHRTIFQKQQRSVISKDTMQPSTTTKLL
jgi:hypothetical protein